MIKRVKLIDVNEIKLSVIMYFDIKFAFSDNLSTINLYLYFCI